MRKLIQIMRDRHSAHTAFDPRRRISAKDMALILEACRWAPTAHNMQNYQVLVIDEPVTLAAISAYKSPPSEDFLRENQQQLAATEDELIQRKTGLLASLFPAAWRTPDIALEEAVDLDHSFLGRSLKQCPALLIVTHDTRLRAPGSEGDMLGHISLGCVMQNMWLMTEALGISMQILSAFNAREAEAHLRGFLDIPEHLQIAFTCRLGYPAHLPGRYLRVRRGIGDFVHHNRFGNRYAVKGNS